MPRLTRRALLALPLAAPAVAETLDRPARILIGFPPGGSVDLVARLLAEQLRGRYAPTVLVESRSGAGGRLAVEAVKAAPPDGATMLLTPAGILTLHPHVYPAQVRYDAATDFTPVSSLCEASFALVVAPGHPARDGAGFLAWARAQSTPVSYAVPSAGSTAHFAGLRLGQEMGISLTEVPYRGTGPILNDLVGGQVPAAMLPLGGVPPLHREGRLRILGVTAARSPAALPDVRSFADQGWPGLVVEEWFGLLLPARAPAALQAALHQAVLQAAASPALREGLARVDYALATSPEPADLGRRIVAERAQWGELVRRTGFRVEE